MRKLFESIGRLITVIIDFFYPPFRKYVTLQFFRYGVTGVANLLFDWFLYFFIHNYIIQQQELHFFFFALKPHTATLAIKFPITLTTGFLLQKYVTFSNSSNKGKDQIWRYYLVGFTNLGLNYIGIKLLVESLNFYPSIANAVISIVLTAFSYFLQKKYTFKTQRIH